MNGIVQDAALDKRNVAAVAIFAGATVGGETVRIVELDAGDRITSGDFDDFEHMVATP